MDLPNLIERHKQIADGAGGDVRLSNETVMMLERLRDALLMCASHCQGGHSDAGMAAALALDVPFPIDMRNLEAKAAEWGLDADHLWPWLKKMRRRAAVITSSPRSRP